MPDNKSNYPDSVLDAPYWTIEYIVELASNKIAERLTGQLISRDLIEIKIDVLQNLKEGILDGYIVSVENQQKIGWRARNEVHIKPILFLSLRLVLCRD